MQSLAVRLMNIFNASLVPVLAFRYLNTFKVWFPIMSVWTGKIQRGISKGIDEGELRRALHPNDLSLFLICLFLLTSLTTWWPSSLHQSSCCGKGSWGLLSILTSGTSANYYYVVINLPVHRHRRPEKNVICAYHSVWFGMALKGKGLFFFFF